jgi:plasmid stabilization system protein ParE
MAQSRRNRPGLRPILVRPYIVFYRVSSNSIEIVRVLHQRRNFAAVFSDPES